MSKNLKAQVCHKMSMQDIVFQIRAKQKEVILQGVTSQKTDRLVLDKTSSLSKIVLGFHLQKVPGILPDDFWRNFDRMDAMRNGPPFE